MKNFVSQLARKTGQELLKEFKHFNRDQVRYKSKQQIVTKADLLAEKHILSAIRKKYPDHHILSEEAGSKGKKSDYLWIVDPLDGTTNFSIKSPQFGVIIGLAYKGEMKLGAIYIPFNDKLFWAEKGKGATMNNKKIHVSKNSTLKKTFVTYCHGSSPKNVRRITEVYKGMKIKYGDIRQLGASSMEMAWVAAGYTDGNFAPGSHVWDVATGALLVREAGGKVTDFKNNEWNLKSKDILASNGKIHNQLHKEINKYDI